MGTIEAQLGGASSDFFESGSWPVLAAPSDSTDSRGWLLYLHPNLTAISSS